MSDAKKTGSRDISELKQRLGLKKSGGAPSQSSSSSRSNGAGGGVVPPPGMNLPPPPGLAPPEPQLPNAADDPFGAMNAIAAQAQVQRAPEFVIVNDGHPVEHVGPSKGAASLLRIIVPAAIALVIGLVIGKIGTKASFYNDGLSGAKAILGNRQTPSTVAYLKKTLADIDSVLDDAKTKRNFAPDLNVDKQLTALARKLDVKSDLVYSASEKSLDPLTSAKILSFYAGVAEVRQMIEQHNKAALGDDLVLKKGKQAAAAATLTENDIAMLAGRSKYAVMVQAPTDTDKVRFGAKLVELAGMYCGTDPSVQAKCPQGVVPSGFAYRNEPGGTPIKGDLETSGEDSVPTRKLLLLLPNGIRDALVQGSQPAVSAVLYRHRLQAIYQRIHGKVAAGGKAVGGLIEDGNKLETRLQLEAAKGHRFSFFM